MIHAKKRGIILIILFMMSGVFYYHLIQNEVIYYEEEIIRVIDGDTVEFSSGKHFRLQGINTPEISEDFYLQAKEFLEERILLKKVSVEETGLEKYGRSLGYLFLDKSNINEELLRKGLATLYFYGESKYYDDFSRAEFYARENSIGLWKKSSHANCIELIELQFKENPIRCSNAEKLILKNNCNVDIEITIKDDATHRYREVIKADSLFSKLFSCIFNDDGDSLYLRDEGGLLLFYRY